MFSSLNKMKESGYLKNILTLLSGSILAQLIPILTAPILSRVYTPEDFGVLSLFLATVSILLLISTMRLEMAIMQVSRKKELTSVIMLISVFIFFFFIVNTVCLIIFNKDISLLLGNSNLAIWLYLVPLAVLLGAVYQVFYYIFVRKSKFYTVSKNKVLMSSSNAFFQISLGLSVAGPAGLIVGNLASQFTALYSMIKAGSANVFVFYTLKNRKSLSTTLSNTLNKYANFPKYDLPASLLSSLTLHLPLFALGLSFGVAVAGIYAFTFKILMMPINVVSKSVLDAFKFEAVKELRNHGTCRRVFILTFKKLSLISVLPFVTLGVFGEHLFEIVFGEQWADAGITAQILAPALMMKFIVSPLSYVFYLYNKQKMDMFGQLFLLLLTVGALLLGHFYSDYHLTIILLSTTFSIVYLFYFFLCFRITGGVYHVKEN